MKKEELKSKNSNLKVFDFIAENELQTYGASTRVK